MTSIDQVLNSSYEQGFNNGIDKFIKTMSERLTDAIRQEDVESVCNLMADIAEQLKVGVKNERS